MTVLFALPERLECWRIYDNSSGVLISKVLEALFANSFLIKGRWEALISSSFPASSCWCFGISVTEIRQIEISTVLFDACGFVLESIID